MSLYYCVDLLTWRIQSIESRQHNYFYTRLMRHTHLNRLAHEKELAKLLLTSFERRVQEDDYQDLNYESELIQRYTERFGRNPRYLTEIEQDLRHIGELIQRHPKHAQYRNPLLGKYETSKYKIACINQGRDYRLGKSKGECFGYAYAMAVPELSLFKRRNNTSIRTNPIPKFDFNQTIYDYQKNQHNPDRKIRKIRLTHRIFCPDIEKQAIQLLSLLKKRPGQEFYIRLQHRNGAHAIYLASDDNGFINYMDANCGAYIFKKPKDFVNFYILYYSINYRRNNDSKYKFYEVAKILYDDDETIRESKTLKGKFRTFLSGAKYADSVLLSTFISGLLYYALIAAISYPIIILQPVAFAVIFVVLFIIIFTLFFVAASKGYNGLFGIPDYIRELWHDFTVKNEDNKPELKAENSTEPVILSNTLQEDDNLVYTRLFNTESDTIHNQPDDDELCESNELNTEILRLA